MPQEINSDIPPIAEAMKGAAEFSEVQEMELSRRVGHDVIDLLEASGLDNRLLDTFRANVVNTMNVQLDGVNDGEKSWMETVLPLNTSDTALSSTLVIGRRSIERWAGILNTAFEQQDVQPQYPEQAYDIANVWLAAHELGHGLGKIYAWLHRTESSHPGRWAYPVSSDKFSLAHPELALAPHPDDATLIEGERQAEGIGSLYLHQVLTETGIVDEPQATAVVEAIRTIQDERATLAKSMLRPDTSLADANAGKDIADWVTANIIGYANPLNPEELRQRFALQEEALYPS